MPSSSDKEVTLTCCAGFSEGLSPIFNHKRISHSHTSEGVFYHTSAHKRMAVFSFYKGKFHFSRGGEDELKKAAKNGGMGFMQWYIIENYTQRPYCYKHSKKICFRALCELNGKLCIIEAKDPMDYKTFVVKLMARKVKYAMYLDTDYGVGTGDRPVSYPFFSGYGRDEAFPQDTDLSPAGSGDRSLIRFCVAYTICVNGQTLNEKSCPPLLI